MALTAQQLEARRTGIGGSDVAAICGLSRFRSPLDVYMEKVHPEQVEQKEGEDIDRGNFLEGSLLQWAAKKAGYTELVRPAQEHSAILPWAFYNADGLARDGAPGRIICEVKAPGPWSMGGWGKEGSDEVPVEYLLQVQWGMFVYNLGRAHVIALIDGECRIFPVLRDNALIEDLVKRCADFWFNHVVEKKEPPLTARDTSWLQKRFPRHAGEYLVQAELNESALKAVTIWKEAREQKRVWEGVEEDAANHIRLLLKERPGLKLDDGARIDWKANKDRQETDWEAVARALARDFGDFAATAGNEARIAEAALDVYVKQHTTTKPGARPLYFRPAKEK